jgi:hypothetical protein
MQIEQKIGCPTVNLGLHAGIGLNGVLGYAEEIVREGDLVVYFPEYGLLSGEGKGWLTAAYGAARRRPTHAGVGLKDKLYLLFRSGTTTLTSFGKSLWVLLSNERGRAHTFVNSHGDVASFLTGQEPSPGYEVDTEVSDYGRMRLEMFKELLSSRKASLLFSLPWLHASPGHSANLSRVRTISEELRQIAPVITHGEHFNLQPDITLFSDSNYHANSAGRAIHTRSLIMEIRKEIAAMSWRCDAG